MRPDLAECEPSLPNPFRNSPVINTKFGNNTHVRVPTITEHDTTESRQSRLQCGTAECDRIAFRQCPDHPEYMATVVGFQMRGFPDSAELLTSGVTLLLTRRSDVTSLDVCVCVSFIDSTLTGPP